MYLGQKYLQKMLKSFKQLYISFESKLILQIYPNYNQKGIISCSLEIYF